MANETTTIRTSLPMRVIGALALDPLLYEEVEADHGATAQALLIVVLSSLSAGYGARGFGYGDARSVAVITGIALLSWITWATVTFTIGTRLVPEPQTRADVGELLRTLGFAAAPGLLRAFGVVPQAAPWAFSVTAVWMLCAQVVAVRQALDYRSTARALGVCVLGWVLAILLAALLSAIATPTVS